MCNDIIKVYKCLAQEIFLLLEEKRTECELDEMLENERILFSSSLFLYFLLFVISDFILTTTEEFLRYNLESSLSLFASHLLRS